MAAMRDLPRRVSTRVQETLAAEVPVDTDQCGGCGTRYPLTRDTVPGCCPACLPCTRVERYET